MRRERPRCCRNTDNTEEFPSPQVRPPELRRNIVTVQVAELEGVKPTSPLERESRADVRFGSNADFDTQISMSALPPKADAGRLTCRE